jgi:uroporphyrinogen-III synthase
VLVTRERPGELAEILTARGATVIHVPLVAVTEPSDGGAALRRALSDLREFDWLVVASAAGAERVGSAVAGVPGIRLAAVGTATARELEACAGRPVDLVPAVQRADALVAAFVERESSPQRLLVAQADIAAPTLADGLRAAGHDVTVVTAYRTVSPEPDRAAELADEVAVAGVDAVLFASGSAVESWCRRFGVETPPVAVAIGPTTAAAADRFGLKLSAVATDHSLDGLVTELERVVARSRVDRVRPVAAPGMNADPPDLTPGPGRETK